MFFALHAWTKPGSRAGQPEDRQCQSSARGTPATTSRPVTPGQASPGSGTMGTGRSGKAATPNYKI